MIALLKNTITGIAVFETYEHWIEYFEKYNTKYELKHDKKKKDSQDILDTHSSCKLGWSSSMSQHFIAGMAAGCVHSLLYMTIESAKWIKRHGFYLTLYPPMPSMALYGTCHMFHHGFSHALMFSSYEGTKRLLFWCSNQAGNTCNHVIGKTSHHISVPNMFVIGIAGGIAGQIYHVASHAVGSFLFFMLNNQPSDHVKLDRQRSTLPSAQFLLSKRSIVLKSIVPSPRSVLLAFPPSALGFIAFEFGKTVM
jgi:hypothetical protein